MSETVQLNPPHLFNAYIDPLRRRLESENPCLCKLFGIALAIVLYADEAARPADDLASLQRSLDILVSYCNEHRLYISVPKSFITIFHAENDPSIEYRSGAVFVDGVKQSVYIYGHEISAVRSFKYLGVVIDSSGTAASHLESRLAAFQKAVHSLYAGLHRLPAFSFQFLVYLWQSLVLPVLCYGVEVFSWSEDNVNAFSRVEHAALKRCLGCSGRSPKHAVQCLTGLDPCTLEWRVRRLGFFLRLLNSPADSWQHQALVYHRNTSTHWYNTCALDLALVLPDVTLHSGFHTETGHDLIYSNGLWSDVGAWMCIHPYSFEKDLLGRRCGRLQRHGLRPPSVLNAIRMHVRAITAQFRVHLRRQAQSNLFSEISQRNAVDAYAKTSLLSIRLTTPGPSMPCLLEFVGLRLHRQAICALFSGDWFLGRYAGNYFAKEFIPTTALQLERARGCGVDPSRVCLHCWHCRREVVLEDELHVLWLCPRYDEARAHFVDALTASTHAAFVAATSASEQFAVMLASSAPVDWQAFGHFAHRVRQSSRLMRTQFETRARKLMKYSFIVRKAAWRSKGRAVCRHGIFFNIAQAGFQCPCLSSSPDMSPLWQKAAHSCRLSTQICVALSLYPLTQQADSACGLFSTPCGCKMRVPSQVLCCSVQFHFGGLVVRGN